MRSMIGWICSLIGTGFPYRSNARWAEEYLAMFKTIMLQAAGIRRRGVDAGERHIDGSTV